MHFSPILTLIKNPIAVIKDGIRAQYERECKKAVKSKFNLEQLPTISIIELFPDFTENLDCYSFLEGTSLITDIMLLKSLARTFDNCSYLEIGSWRGESIANVSDVAEDCTSVTLSDEEMRVHKMNEDFIQVHGIFSKNKKNITTIRKDSHVYDFSKLNKKFDLIFIDGDHSYSGVLNDTKKIFTLRRNANSIIVWHDYGLNTEDVRYSVLKGILDGISNEKHENLFHVSNTMCAIYIEGKRFNKEFTRFPTYPDKKFLIQLKAEKL